jgi:hypothetical protein
MFLFCVNMYMGVTGGRFLSMITSATHPRWPLCSPLWIWSPLIFWRMPWSTGLIFWWLIGGNWRKVPFDDRSSNMAAILDLVTVDYLTNACRRRSIFLVPRGSSIFNMFQFSLNLIVHTPTDKTSQSGAYATPCVALICCCFRNMTRIHRGFLRLLSKVDYAWNVRLATMWKLSWFDYHVVKAALFRWRLSYFQHQPIRKFNFVN